MLFTTHIWKLGLTKVDHFKLQELKKAYAAQSWFETQAFILEQFCHGINMVECSFKTCEIHCKFARRRHGEGDKVGFDNPFGRKPMLPIGFRISNGFSQTGGMALHCFLCSPKNSMQRGL